MQKTSLKRLVFIDIETVPIEATYDKLPTLVQELWTHKTSYSRWSEISPEDSYEQKAGIYAEFGKVVCISIAYFNSAGNNLQLRVKSFFGHDEETLLRNFSKLMAGHFNNTFDHVLCGHNIKEFDVPYLCRRFIINGLQIPRLLNLSGLKPWEIPHLDTMQFWKFGDYKNFTSLKHLAYLLGVPSPKTDISGADVARVYWEDNDLERIQRYCAKDVITIAQLILKFRGLDLLDESQIEIIS